MQCVFSKSINNRPAVSGKEYATDIILVELLEKLMVNAVK